MAGFFVGGLHEQRCEGSHHVVAKLPVRQAFPPPIVAHEVPDTTRPGYFGNSVGLLARQHADVLRVGFNAVAIQKVVADVGAEGSLLVEQGLGPFGASLVAHLGGAFGPVFEQAL